MILTKRAASHSTDSVERRLRGVDFLSAFLLLVFVVAPAPVDGKIAGLESWCPFFNVVSLPCPFCGLTRSLVFGAHFQFETAMQYHVLGPLLLAALLVSSTRLLICVLPSAFFRARILRLCRAIYGVTPRFRARFGLVALVALTLFAWIARLAGFLPLPHI